MQERLATQNRALLRDLAELVRNLQRKKVPHELREYRTRLLDVCSQFRKKCEKNLADLAHTPELLEDVLSETQQVTQTVRLLSTRLAGPVLRASPKDRLCLTTIKWLHTHHARTATIPAAFADGDCAVWPFRLRIAPVYFFPSVEQQGLLYQPLFFHEFGHLLYVFHKNKMDELVRDLQREIEARLVPASQRNDRYADMQAAERLTVSLTWYRWTQEFFCDAVGLSIGGPCFLRAFSGYLGTMDRGDFYREPEHLQGSTHPVKWLRIRLLVTRAKMLGFPDVAREVEEGWALVARTMGIREDYHGYYAQSFSDAVTQTIEVMLTRADPYRWTQTHEQEEDERNNSHSIVSLLNQAWEKYQIDPEGYGAWEIEAVRRLLG
jgi:hypothetical protein